MKSKEKFCEDLILKISALRRKEQQSLEKEVQEGRPGSTLAYENKCKIKAFNEACDIIIAACEK